MSSKSCTGVVAGLMSVRWHRPLPEVQSGVALVSPRPLVGCVELPSRGQGAEHQYWLQRRSFREGAGARAAVPQLWEQKLKMAFCMMTEENPLFSWLAVNAVFLSSLGSFPRERWDHKPH